VTPTLPDWARIEIQRTFGHYASLADPLNRTTLTSQKFGRFLRDCGLLSMEAQGAVSFNFVPEGRVRGSSKPRGSVDAMMGANPGRLQRSNSTGSLKRNSLPTRRGSGAGLDVSLESRRASFAVSNQAQSSSQLPLKVFPVPPLSQVEVDLIFVQATRPEDSQERRRSVVKAGGGSKRLMTVESFTKALVDVAMQVMAPEDVSNSLEDFCKRVIQPLNEVLLRSRSEDLLGVLNLKEKPQVKRLLEDCSSGLQKLFLCYAAEPTARRAHWNADSVTRFAIDFDFLGEVSNLPLQRMFQDACCQNSSNLRADEKLFQDGFPLFLLMLANKTHAGQACPVEQDRVPLLFQRINAIACTSTQAPRFGLAKEPLLPLPKEMGTRRSSLQSLGLEDSRRHEETGLSWDELLNSTF